MTPTMIDATEILGPAPRVLVSRMRPANGPTVEIVALAGVPLLVLAILIAGGAKPGSPARADARLPAAVVAPASVPLAVAAPVAVAPVAAVGRTPGVLGMRRDAAAAALLAAGYRSVSWIAESGHTAPAGTVVRQEPPAGSPLQPRTTARLTVAR